MPAARRLADLSSPRLPWPLRLANRVGAPLAARLASLEEGSLLAAARERTGLDDFGDARFLEPLRVLLDALEREAGLSPLGRFATRQLLVQLLSNRLLVESCIRRRPQLLDTPVERPLVIAGLPRTGTTHLHNLLSPDPAWRTLPYWESLEPVPHPRDSARPGQPDPRIARCQRALQLLDYAMPHFRSMHEMTAESAHEEIQLLALDFSTMLFEASYHVPSYRDWYKSHDQTPSYRYLRRVLQVIQWLRGGARRWALKSPQHLEQLGPLMDAFPDASVVQTHRDPLRITASLCTMVAYGSRMQAREVDAESVGRYWAARVEDLLRGSITGRRHVPPGRILDLRFHEFMEDELGTLQRVYRFAGEPWSPETARGARAYLETHTRARHGAIAYCLADVGLDAGERREALRFYQARFALPSEA